MRRPWILLPLALFSCFSEPEGSQTDATTESDPGSTGAVDGDDTTSSSTAAATDGTTVGADETSSTGTTSTSAETETTSAADTTGDPRPVSFCELNRTTADACEDFDSRGFTWVFETNGYAFDLIPKGEGPNQAIRLTADKSGSGPPTRAWHRVDEVSAAARIQLSFDIRLPEPNPHASVCGDRDWFRAAEFAYLGPAAALTNLVFEVGPASIRAFLSTPSATQVVWQTVAPDTLGVWLTVEATLDLSAEAELSVIVDGEESEPVVLDDFSPLDVGVSVNVGPWHDENGDLPDGCYYDFDDLLLEIDDNP